MSTHSINVVRPVMGTMAILLLPYLSMQFTNEVNWNRFDFIVAGIVLLSFGFAFEILSVKVKNKIILGLILLAMFLLVWAELAVGVIGTPFAGN